MLGCRPIKRPKAGGLQELFYNLYSDVFDKKEFSEIYKQVKKINEINEKLLSNSSPSLSTGAL